MYWEFNQNNSGGRFVVNDKLCHRVIVEAHSFEQAVEKAEELGCYWQGVSQGIDCPCCGDRWSKWENKVKAETLEEVIKHYQDLANRYGWTVPDCRIFLLNGEVIEILIQK